MLLSRQETQFQSGFTQVIQLMLLPAFFDNSIVQAFLVPFKTSPGGATRRHVLGDLIPIEAFIARGKLQQGHILRHKRPHRNILSDLIYKMKGGVRI